VRDAVARQADELTALQIDPGAQAGLVRGPTVVPIAVLR
jgi:hypothetical protein